MRIYCGIVHTTKIAKGLKRALADEGFELGLMRTRETVARMLGYANFHELRAVALREDCPARSQKDQEVSTEEAAARREQYVRTLSNVTGLDRAVAEKVVDAVNPTGQRPKRNGVEVTAVGLGPA
jgi:hypothetical protein